MAKPLSLLALAVWVAIVLAALSAAASDLTAVSPVTDKVLMLTFVDGRAVHETLGHGHNGRIEAVPLDVDRAQRPESYLISSRSDRAYGRGQHPIRVGRKAKGTDFARVQQWKLGHVLTHWVYLVLPKPLRRGGAYTVTVGRLATKTRRLTFTFHERRTRSETIHVNQVGYVPDAPHKLAYLHAWMGDLGPLALDDYADSPFHLVDVKSGKVALTGKPKLRRRADGPPDDAWKAPHIGADVWELDFSALRAPGEYFITVERIGRSFPFRIDEDVYREAFRATARGLYHQRCGTVRKKPYSRWVRRRCHHPKDKPVIQSRRPLMKGSNAFKELPAQSTGQRRPYWGGYHDAGDWDRRIQHLRVADCLLLVFELAPGKFADGELNIPESGNGVADIVDEARWGVDFFRRMQQPDGGVCGGIESTAHPKFGETSTTDTLPLYVYAPDPDASLRYAATAARMCRCLKLAGRADDAKGYLESARRAWAWALANGGRDARHRDIRAHAAAELFATTGEGAFRDAFRNACVIATSTTPLSEWKKHDQQWAVWAYVTTKQPNVDAALQQRLHDATLHWAKIQCIDTAGRRGGRYAYHWWRPVGYGSATTPATLPLIVAHHLTKDPKYLAPQYTTCDYTLGGNPLNICWVTGLGDRPCRAVLHIESLYDGIADPVPGIVPYGPLRYKAKGKGLNWTHSWGQNTAYPPADRWPAHELWFGNYMSPAQAEFTVQESIGPAAAAYAYLCAERKK